MLILSDAELRKLLHYDPESGLFVWRHVSRVGMSKGGLPTSSRLTDKGYLVVTILRHAYAAHRLAWLYVYGKWPDGEIDHINGKRDDNRLSNLRDLPKAINIQNQRRAQRTNRCGLLGVSTRPNGRFWARINTGGKRLSLGVYRTAEEAHVAYVEAKRRLHEGCTL